MSILWKKIIFVVLKELLTTNLKPTENHPFYVEGKGWCAVAELQDGDVLRTQDGETEIVANA